MVLASKEQVELCMLAGQKSFPYFIEHILPTAFDEEFAEAPHQQAWAKTIQENSHVALLAARNHLKSSTIYAYVLWEIFRHPEQNLEILYLSYKSDLAAYHTTKIKELMKRIPLMSNIIELTPAESVIKTTTDRVHKVTVEPDGIMAFKRGRHPDIVICDDILADPANVSNLTVLQKIDRIFYEDVLSLPKANTGKLILIGTPQDAKDVFFTIKSRSKRFVWGKYPAIINKETGEVLWEQVFPLKKLQQIEADMGSRSFNKEYMCYPVRSEEMFFRLEQINKCINKDLKNERGYDGKNMVFAGWDLGKKRHPSHIAIFEYDPENNRTRQLKSMWLDNMDYTQQLAIIKSLIKSFKIDELYFDNTRGELEMEVEKNSLPYQMKPIIFKKQNKFAMATEFEKAVNGKRHVLELINDERQIDQILQVDNELKAIETAAGHGDSFWSVALAIWAKSMELDRYKGGGGELI